MRRVHGLFAAAAKSTTYKKKKKLLLVPHMEVGLSYKPDRTTAVATLQQNEFLMANKTSHEQFLRAIAWHKFTVAPFGRGLDTHRLTEILLMGGVPVIRKSTISSCYDDTDNVIGDGLRRVSIIDFLFCIRIYSFDRLFDLLITFICYLCSGLYTCGGCEQLERRDQGAAGAGVGEDFCRAASSLGLAPTVRRPLDRAHRLSPATLK